LYAAWYLGPVDRMNQRTIDGKVIASLFYLHA